MEAERKTRQLEYENRDVSAKVRDDEADLRDKLKELSMMKSENDRAQEIIRELEYQNEHEEEEFHRIRNVADQERRQTLAQEDAYNRKLRSLEEEKRRLEAKARDEQGRGKQY